MKVLFINPNRTPALNMGLTYVMSAVEKEHQVGFLDLGLYGKQCRRVLEKHVNDDVRVVAFSAFTHNFQNALQAAQLIKGLSPATKIIFGGVHPTLCPEEVMAQPAVDALCIGEGEGAFKEYLDCLSQGQEPLVRGIWFKNCRGDWVQNPPRPFCQDLDTLAFPNWDYWDLDYYIHKLDERLGFISSRGCPYGCSFCSNPALRKVIPGDFLRQRIARQVITEIEFSIAKYSRFGFEYIRFDDEVFGLDQAFLEDYCRLYIQKGLHRRLPWFCQTRVDLLTEKYVDLIAAAGCAVVGLGVETGDDGVRNRIYKKCFSNQALAKAVDLLKKKNIACLFYLMYNAPGTDAQERKKTRQLVARLKPLRATFSPFMFLPKTELAMAYSPPLAHKRSRLSQPPAGIVCNTNKLLSVVYLWVRIRNSFDSGLRLKGVGFIADLFRFIYLKVFCLKVKLFSLSGLERGLFQLEYFTIFKYAIDRAKKNFKPTV